MNITHISLLISGKPLRSSEFYLNGSSNLAKTAEIFRL